MFKCPSVCLYVLHAVDAAAQIIIYFQGELFSIITNANKLATKRGYVFKKRIFFIFFLTPKILKTKCRRFYMKFHLFTQPLKIRENAIAILAISK